MLYRRFMPVSFGTGSQRVGRMPDRRSLPRYQLSGRILFRRKLFVLQRLFLERFKVCRK